MTDTHKRLVYLQLNRFLSWIEKMKGRGMQKMTQKIGSTGHKSNDREGEQIHTIHNLVIAGLKPRRLRRRQIDGAQTPREDCQA
jgi:hypothetical protein